MTEVARSVVHDVLGQRVVDVDQPIVDYIVNVLADDDFDFGLDGEGAFDALGELLVAADCVDDFSHCRSVSPNPNPSFISFKVIHLFIHETLSLLNAGVQHAVRQVREARFGEGEARCSKPCGAVSNERGDGRRASSQEEARARRRPSSLGTRPVKAGEAKTQG